MLNETPEECEARIQEFLAERRRYKVEEGVKDDEQVADAEQPYYSRGRFADDEGNGIHELDAATISEGLRQSAEEDRRRNGHHAYSPPPVFRGHTKPLNRKTFRIVIRGLSDPHHYLKLFWERFGDKEDRLEKHTSKVVTNISVLDEGLVMFVDYTVRGGHPADLRRWIGRLVYGDPTRGDQVGAKRIETVRLQDNGQPVLDATEEGAA